MIVAKTSTARSLCHGEAGIAVFRYYHNNNNNNNNNNTNRLQSLSAFLPSDPLPYRGP